MVYVMLHELSFWDLVSSKTKDLVSKEQSAHFYEWLEKEADKLNIVEDQELQLDLQLELSKAMKIPMRTLENPYQIIKQCEDIIEEVFHQLHKQQKDFRSAYERSVEKNKLEFLIHWEMTELFSYLNEKRKKEEEASATVWAREVLQYVEQLPSHQSEQLKHQLNIVEWTEKEAGAALERNPLLLFTMIVKKAGFGFYKYLLHSFAKKKEAGAAEMAEAPYFSGLMDPDLLLPLIFRSGNILYRYQNLLFNKGLLPVVLLETALPYLADQAEEEVDDEKLAIISQSWNWRLVNYKNMLRAVNEMIQKQNDWSKGLSILKEELKEEESAFQQAETYNKQLYEKLKNLLKKDPARPYFGELSVKNNRYQESLKRIEEKMQKQAESKKGIIRSVSKFIKSSYYQTEKIQLEKRIEKVFDEMTALVLEKYQNYEPRLIEEIYASNEQLARLQTKQQDLQQRIRKFETKLAEVKRQEKETRSDIAEAEKRTYGLSQMYRLEMEKEANAHTDAK